MTKIKCHCGEVLEVEIPAVVDFDKSPEKKIEILNGSFLTFRCQGCQSELKPECPIRFLENNGQWDLFLIPEIDRGKWFRGKLLYHVPEESLIAISYPELVEKITLREQNLDDRAVEVLKYTLLSRMLEQDDAPDEVRIFFKGREKDSLVFYIEGLKKDEIGMTGLPYSAYERSFENISHSMKQDPFSSILLPPYISINRLYHEEN